MRFRISALALTVAAIAWFNLFQDSSAAATAQRAADLLDGRPARSILIIGNSRTFHNDMPSMLRDIADSASSPTKFQIEVSAKAGASFESLWQDGRTRRLLGTMWDDVILQGESRAQSTEELNDSFLKFGAQLGRIAKVRQGRPRLVVNWAYDPALYEGDADGTGRASHLDQIKSMHAKLGNEAGMDRVNLAGLWESVRRSHPSIKLTVDGNHPTIAGSYLFALALYAHLSNGPVAQVSYVPEGVDPADAQVLRDAVDAFPLFA